MARNDSLSISCAPDGGGAKSPPHSGVSFAKIAALGFAATGPVLASTSPGASLTIAGGSSPPGSAHRPAWGRAAAAGGQQSPGLATHPGGPRPQAWGGAGVGNPFPWGAVAQPHAISPLGRTSPPAAASTPEAKVSQSIYSTNAA